MLRDASPWAHILGFVLGVIAAAAFIPWANMYIWWLLAVVGGIALGVIVYLIVLRLLGIRR